MTDSDHVWDALAETGIPFDFLSEADSESVMELLAERLGIDTAKQWLWDDQSAPSGVHRPDGWRDIAVYVGDRPHLLFVDGHDLVWRLRRGEDLLTLLGAAPALEFYVCDDAATYLLCHNHHDRVVGWGEAETWVRSLPPA